MYRTDRWKREKGQGLVEYALILVLVAIVVIAVLALLGPSIGNIYKNLVTNLTNPLPAAATAPTATTAPTGGTSASFICPPDDLVFVYWNTAYLGRMYCELYGGSANNPTTVPYNYNNPPSGTLVEFYNSSHSTRFGVYTVP